MFGEGPSAKTIETRSVVRSTIVRVSENVSKDSMVRAKPHQACCHPEIGRIVRALQTRSIVAEKFLVGQRLEDQHVQRDVRATVEIQHHGSDVIGDVRLKVHAGRVPMTKEIFRL